MKKTFTFWAFCIVTCLLYGNASAVAFFTVEWTNGKAWFKTPSGKPFLSMGVNAIADQSMRAPNSHYYDPVKNQYKDDKKAWTANVFSRLKKWHFNTVGCWSDHDLEQKKFPYTTQLYIARGNPWDNVLNSVFDEAFEKRVVENAQKAEKYKNDPDLIGYFLDNEMPWWGNYGWNADGQKTLLERYAAVNIEGPNKDALKKFFEDRYEKDIDPFNGVWNTNLKSFDELDRPLSLVAKTKKQKADANAWAGVVAERYFSVAVKALRAVDPNHLILGIRFAGETPWEVVDACGKYCDVVSVNAYNKSGNVDQVLLNNVYAKTKRPILITEYSFTAKENQSGDPNTQGADVLVPTQADRAEHLDRFVHQALNLPYLVGLHWFQWADESPEGRFDGENCNYGLVDINDKDYALITQKHTALNLLADSLHKTAVSPLPGEFSPPGEAVYRKADAGVKVTNTRSFLKIEPSAPVSTWSDPGNTSKVEVDLSSGVVAVDFNSGSGIGCGVKCSSNVEPLAAPGVVDLRGYNLLQFEAFIPKGLQVDVFLSESGNNDPNSSDHAGVQGADGESYTFPSLMGTGKWETFRINLADLERRTSWGNQQGNNILDLQGLASVDFSISANQGSGKILVKNLQFQVK